MNEETKSMALGTRAIINNQYQNRIIYKCKKERSYLINSEISKLIKKQMKIFNSSKKIYKQIEDTQKQNIVMAIPQTPIQKVQRFRLQQSHKQWEKVKNFKVKEEQKRKKLENKLKEKQQINISKSSQKHHKFQKVQNKFKENLLKQVQKTEQLSKSLVNLTPRQAPKIIPCSLLSQQRIFRRVKNIQKLNQEKQKKFNQFIVRMKACQEQRINKQVQNQIGKNKIIKIVPKFSVAQRNNAQQIMMATWSHNFEERFQKFQQHTIAIQQQRHKHIMDKSMERNSTKQQVFFRKLENEQKIAQKRIQLVKQKMNKINKIRSRLSTNKSLIKLNHNLRKVQQDLQKQQHNVIFRKIYYVLQKLKKMPFSEKLKKYQINLLLKNLDPNCEQYKQVSRYLLQGQEKFLQQKKKD